MSENKEGKKSNWDINIELERQEKTARLRDMEQLAEIRARELERMKAMDDDLLAHRRLCERSFVDYAEFTKAVAESNARIAGALEKIADTLGRR